MKRVIVDYAKLTNEILTLLVEKFPDGYDDSEYYSYLKMLKMRLLKLLKFEQKILFI